MTTFIAFLRGINVGGNTILPMKDLVVLCTELGFRDVKTYINSGNVVFKSSISEKAVTSKLEKILLVQMGKEISVIIRTSSELESIIKNNPFPQANPSQVGVTLFAESVSRKMLEDIVIPGKEEVRMEGREIYIHFPKGMGKSKIKLPASIIAGTVRNINTITKLVQLSGDF